jgi:hypothetical protein
MGVPIDPAFLHAVREARVEEGVVDQAALVRTGFVDP